MTEPLKTDTWESRLDGALHAMSGLAELAPDAKLAAPFKETLLAFFADVQYLVGEEEMNDVTLAKLSSLLTRTANVLKGEPGPLSLHSWHDLPESAAAAMQPDLKAIRHAAASFDLWWTMVQAESELAGEPIADDTNILYFMGSGASHMVRADQLRTMCAAIYGVQPEPASAP